MDMERLLDQLHYFEGHGPKNGDRFMPYRDTKGFLTIGYGYNLDANGLPSRIVDWLLQDKANEAYAALEAGFPGFSFLNDVRQRVLTDMGYNMGPQWFRGWPIFQGQVQRGEWLAAANNMRSTKWARDVGPRRYLPLSKMMETGEDA